jgi:small basic protein (TIGR04137 family)
MSIHPSLGAAVKGKQQKSVLKRAERIKYLMGKGLWKEDHKVFGLPKIKAVRIKMKKEKAEKPAEGEAAAGAAAPAAAEPKAKAAAPKK